MVLQIVLTIMLYIATAHAAPIIKEVCIKDCIGRPTGDYQSCLGCHVYASCVTGFLYDGRPCPTGLVWDDNAKQCLTTSSTCKTTTTTRATTTRTTHPSRPSPSTLWPEITTEATTGGPATRTTHPFTSPSASTWPEITTESPLKDKLWRSGNKEICVSSCKGHKDGDYQSCLGCHIYASCVNGRLIDNRPCPGGLVWDDNAKNCLKTSSTCKTTTTTRAPPTTTTHASRPSPSTALPEITTEGTTRVPVMTTTHPSKPSSSSTWPELTTEATTGAPVMSTTHHSKPSSSSTWPEITTQATTGAPVITTAHPSKPSSSSTWPEITTEANTGDMAQKISNRNICVSSCKGQKDGDYQSCLGCHIYASCVNGRLIDNRPCPGGLVWDDNAKNCLKTSSTCKTSTTKRAPPTTTTHVSRPSSSSTLWPEITTEATTADHSATTTQSSKPSSSTTWPDITTVATTGDMARKRNSKDICVSSCKGRKDGDYQSCLGCHVYVSCVNGLLINNRPCPPGLVWDDNDKSCLESSSTCQMSTTTKAPTTTTTSKPTGTDPASTYHPDTTASPTHLPNTTQDIINL